MYNGSLQQKGSREMKANFKRILTAVLFAVLFSCLFLVSAGADLSTPEGNAGQVCTFTVSCYGTNANIVLRQDARGNLIQVSNWDSTQRVKNTFAMYHVSVSSPYGMTQNYEWTDETLTLNFTTSGTWFVTATPYTMAEMDSVLSTYPTTDFLYRCSGWASYPEWSVFSTYACTCAAPSASTPTYYYYRTPTPTAYRFTTPTPTYYYYRTPTPTYYYYRTPTPTYYYRTPTPTYYYYRTPTPTYYYYRTPTPTYYYYRTPTPTAYVPPAQTPRLGISGPNYPSDMRQGQSFSIRGTVYTDVGRLTEVRGEIIDNNNRAAQSVTVYPNTQSYTLGSGDINRRLKFGQLAPGLYRYRITASAVNGSRSNQDILIDCYFRIIENVTPTPVPTHVPITPVPTPLITPTPRITPVPTPTAVPTPTPTPRPTPVPTPVPTQPPVGPGGVIFPAWSDTQFRPETCKNELNQNRYEKLPALTDDNSETRFQWYIYNSEYHDEIPEFTFYFDNQTVTGIGLRNGWNASETRFYKNAWLYKFHLMIYTADGGCYREDIRLKDYFVRDYQDLLFSASYQNVQRIEMFVDSYKTGTEEKYACYLTDVRFFSDVLY